MGCTHVNIFDFDKRIGNDKNVRLHFTEQSCELISQSFEAANHVVPSSTCYYQLEWNLFAWIDISRTYVDFSGAEKSLFFISDLR